MKCKWYFIRLITSFPINSFYPLDTALVLTSDNFHLIFPPTPHPSPLPVSQPPGGTFQNHWNEHHLYHLFTYICSLLIEKSICDRWNISSFCVLLSGDLFIFWQVSFLFYIYWVIHTSVLSIPHDLYIYLFICKRWIKKLLKKSMNFKIPGEQDCTQIMHSHISTGTT